MKIGVVSESFRKPFAEAVRCAKSLGIDGVQAYAGQAFPFEAGGAQLAELKKFVNGEGLQFSAVCGDNIHGPIPPRRDLGAAHTLHH